MEQSRSLARMLEAADLVGMLEDLTNPAVVNKLSPASLSGMRSTLHMIREIILSSHDSFASGLMNQTRSRRSEPSSIEQGGLRAGPQARDLRASLEKFIDTK